ncbi:hypothetical protein HK102_012685, partial [Quaeritorhiza haematococci]
GSNQQQQQQQRSAGSSATATTNSATATGNSGTSTNDLHLILPSIVGSKKGGKGGNGGKAVTRYYRHVAGLFEDARVSEGVVEFARLALESLGVRKNTANVKRREGDEDGEDEDEDVLRRDLWKIIFTHSLELSMYEGAYAAMTANPDPAIRRDCLRRFVTVLCENGQLDALCSGRFPFVGLQDEVERTLEFKARNGPVVTPYGTL